MHMNKWIIGHFVCFFCISASSIAIVVFVCSTVKLGQDVNTIWMWRRGIIFTFCD